MSASISIVNTGKAAMIAAGKVTEIAVVSNHLMIQEGLCALINNQSGMEVTARVSDASNVLETMQEFMPKVIIVDICMPDLNAGDATREIIAINPDFKIIALSVSFDEFSITGMLQAGVSAYLLMESSSENLIDAIYSVTNGGVYFCPEKVNAIAQKYFDHLSTEQMSFDPNLLSNREREVLQHIANGKNTKEIAFTLHLSPKTVETYRKNLVSKLNINSTALLTKYAIRQGLSYL